MDACACEERYVFLLLRLQRLEYCLLVTSASAGSSSVALLLGLGA